MKFVITLNYKIFQNSESTSITRQNSKHNTICSIYTWVISSVIAAGWLVFKGSTAQTCSMAN